MGRASLRGLSAFLGQAALLVLGCGRDGIAYGTGTGTGSAETDWESSDADDSSGGSSSGNSGSGSSSTGTSSTDSLGTGSSGTGGSASSSTTGTQDTDTTDPVCEPVQLADVALGIGGFTVDGAAADDRSGASVSGAGDVNGDGLADLVVGAHRADANGIEDSGRAYVVFGKKGGGKVSLSIVTLGGGGFAIDGAAWLAYTGYSVSGAGDVNGDGLADVIVGADNTSNHPAFGGAYVVFGKTDTDRVSIVDVALGSGGFTVEPGGRSLSGAGDVNGDGLADVVIGAHGINANGLHECGRTYVVFGKTSTDKVELADVIGGAGGFAIDGEGDEDYSGWSVSGAGDVNGDGLADLIVGANQADANGIEDSGRAYVVFGKTNTDSVLLADVTAGVGGFAMDGENEWDEAGRSVGGAGDVNGDGLADVIVGAPWSEPNGLYSGRAYVVFGKASTDLVALADVAQGVGGFALDGEGYHDYAGSAVSGAGDVNGDGLADVVIGAYEVDANGLALTGRAYVVFGKADTDAIALADVTLGIGGFAVNGESEEDRIGSVVSGAGDVDGDGLADVVMGTDYADPNGDRSGRTYVVFGGDVSCGGR